MITDNSALAFPMNHIGHLSLYIFMYEKKILLDCKFLSANFSPKHLTISFCNVFVVE